ncbi:MAG: AAA family ATPase [Gemmatimonadota bacterium]
MKLLGIEFHGFKSFADSGEIRFHDGMTAIVGPNGCGKSNISDALRWVLGEQKPTAIRGARMEEAIFQGTEKRKPIQRAEVSLLLSNEDGLLPVPYSEVQFSRTVLRGGDGEYRLNGTLCRLRDVQDLCRDTGLGTNAYAIIEARMIDAILSDHAEERREMFEEAAGIGRYKERRRVAGRRLDEAAADLARVDDLVSEVETKVRSLARQRGRARRYHELRERKLALELALAQAEFIRLQERRSEIETELERIAEQRVGHSAGLRTAEAEHENARKQLADLERQRADSARKMMEVRDQLAELEKVRLLAQERARNARERLEQVAVERRELSEHKAELGGEVESLSQKRGDKAAVVHSIQKKLADKEGELTRLSERKDALEAAQDAVESDQQQYREKRAQLQAGIEGARARAEDLGRRHQDAKRQLAATSDAIESAEAAVGKAREEASQARARLERISHQLMTKRAELTKRQVSYEELRNRQAALAERMHATQGRIDAVAPLATGEEGLNPAVQAALRQADQLGILGVLGRSLDVPEEYAQGVESYLGALMEALIVSDSAAAERVRRWFLEQYEGPGGLTILPLDAVPALPDEHATSIPEVHVSGPGGPWVRYLLRDARLSEERGSGGAWIGGRVSIDSLGIYRLGQPYAGAGLLAHRAELQKLRSLLAEFEDQAGELARRIRTGTAEVKSQAARVEDLEAERRTAEEGLARLAARAETANERLAREKEDAEVLGQVLTRLEAERERALGGGTVAEEELQGLKPAGAESAPDPEELASVRRAWDEALEAVAELRLSEARSTADVESLERDVRGRRQGLAAVDERASKLSEEAEILSEILAQSEETSEKVARELEVHFEERSSREAETRGVDERAQELREHVTSLEATLKQIQQQERGESEKGHELDLERSEIQSSLNRVRERLEDEWGRPFDELAAEVEPASGETEELRTELGDVAAQLGGIGLVNMLAEQEHNEERERLEFLSTQRADLVKARDDLRATIREINETASGALVETLEQIRENFGRTFATLFPGGQCDIWLEHPAEPLDSPIEISASPGGKRTQRIHLLSGGERALTALALLFAIYLVKPSPFCVLDEVDAPLDETNIRRFVAMLEQFKSDVQFIVITHNPVTIEAADWIYGVTMEEPGVSKIVGVEFSAYTRGAVA